VKEKLALSFIKTMLHASIVAASSTGTTIARLTDLLFSIEASQLGLVIYHIQVCDFDRSARVSRGSSLVAAVVKNATRRRSDVEEKLALSFTKTVLHASIVAASSTSATIARLTDLLFSIEAGRFGLVVNNIQTMFSESRSLSWNITWRVGRTYRTQDFYCSSRVSRSSSLFTAVVQNASRR